MRYLFLFSLILVFFGCKNEDSKIEITTDFPGGNIVLDSIIQDTVYIRPDNRDSEKPWFHWYFEASSKQSQIITFKFNQKNVMTTFGPSISSDNGMSWNWLFKSPQDQEYFTYEFPDEEARIRFCMAMPYLQSTFESFCSKYQGDVRFQIDELGKTRNGRAIEKVYILPYKKDIKAKILITVRHHASEMMANYIMEGIMDAVMNGENLSFLQDHVEFMFIPFVDKDGVEQGDQGKHRKPRDHNRDYSGESIYASTRKLRNEIPNWSNELPLVALDLHNPWIKYDNNEITYLVGSSNQDIEKEQILFSHILDSAQVGLLKFNKDHFMPFGVAWNTDKNYEKGVSFDSWAGQLPNILLSSTLETPYANNEGQQVTPESARSFGNDIAQALNIYLHLKL